ncbi:AsmA-like C-terminal region-containing protein [Palleronia sp. KMU-117]|uniref:AsmA-like C-terminal region-containing protein n=1 Tax=Palleronia sp. KMU-117 TaxID=3434108 RepID=UPI003D764511
MTETPAEVPQERPSAASAPPVERRRGRLGVWVFAANLLIFLFLVYGVLSLTARPIPLPGRVADAVALRLGAGIAPGSVEIGRVELLVGRDGLPSVLLRDLTLRDGGGAEVARLNDLRARLSPAALVAGRTLPAGISLSGAQITVRRAVDGRFALSFGGSGGGQNPAGSVGDVLAAIETGLAAGPLAGIETVEARDLTITLEDARTGRIWQASNAAIELRRGDGEITVTVISELFNGTEDLADVQLSFRAEPGGGASIGAQIEGMPAGDIALQSPALSFLHLVAAPIDGSLRATFDEDGRLGQFAAALEIGAGAIQPADNAAFALSGGRAYLTYDPVARRINFGEISLASEDLTLAGEGYAYLRDLQDGWPRRLVGQLRLDRAEIRRGDLLEEPVRFDGGAADVNLRLDPFEVEIGQVVLTRGTGPGRRDLRARGRIAVAPEGWHVALDASADRLTPDEVLALWPLGAIPNTRRWIVENVQGGEATGIVGALRIEPGAPPRASVSYDFRGAEVRFLRFFPPITGGQGRAVFADRSYTMVLNEGRVTAPGGDSIALGGSVFRIGDVTRKPDRAEIDLRTEGPVRAALELLNNKPFEILDKSGFDPSVIDARGVALSRISFDLVKNVPKESVDFETTGTLSGVTLAGLKGAPSPIAADSLALSVTRDRLEVSGALTVAGVPVTGRWTQPLKKEAAGRSRVEATLPVSAESLAALNIRIDGLTLSGAAEGQVSLALARGAPPEFTLSSTLSGAAMGLPGVGWSKAAATAGTLEIAGVLGPAPRIDRLSLEAPGLQAEGSVRLAEGGAFAGADFSRVRLGGWLDAPVAIRPRGTGSEIAVLGGRIDLRARPQTQGAAPRRASLSLALQELVLSDAISLRPFNALLPAAGAGRFDARVNGRAEISGDLVPQEGGLAIRARSDDGGAVLSDARILPGAAGGRLSLTLVPDGANGAQRGQLSLTDTVLRDVPTAAKLLDSISVVGLIEDLETQGIHFDTLDARFRIGNGLLRIDEAAAVGGSLGISLDGLYDLRGKRMDLQGVVSPIYVINGIGSLFTRRGEGVFGVSFRMAGPAAAPTITVNPLSILAPGMLRDVFRRPPEVSSTQ